MKKLTKLEALEWCWIIWRDVAAKCKAEDNSDICRVRAGYKSEIVAGYGKEFEHDCPCCEYVRQELNVANFFSVNCNDACPLSTVWRGGRSYACENSESLWSIFHSSKDLVEQCKAAQTIADSAWGLYLKECVAQVVEPEDK